MSRVNVEKEMEIYTYMQMAGAKKIRACSRHTGIPRSTVWDICVKMEKLYGEWWKMGNIKLPNMGVKADKNKWIVAPVAKNLDPPETPRADLKPEIRMSGVPVARITISKETKKTRPWHHARDHKLALIVPDIHVGFRKENGRLEPFHDRRALDIVFQVARDQHPDRIIQLGDLTDLPELSRFQQLPDFQQLAQPAVIEASYIMGKL